MRSSRPLYVRLVALLGALLLVPLVALLSAAPAQAAPGVLSGTVENAVGDPLAGVTVEALTGLGVPTGTSATTLGDGTYTVPLAEGSYQLRYSRTGYDTRLYGDGAVIDVDADGQASVAGEPVVDNALDPVALVGQATYPITGTVVGAGGLPLPGLTVAIYAADDESTALDTTTTGATGAFSLTRPAGTYHLQVTDPAHLYLSQWYGGDTRDITVTGPTTLDPVTLQPVPADAEFPISGTVVDANDEPVSGVSVAVDHVGGSTDSGTGTTNGTGGYAVSVLPGTYQVTFTKTGWTTAQYGHGATVTVAADGTLSVLPVETLTGNKLGDQVLASTPFSISGTVKASGGSSIAGGTVRAFPAGSTDVAEVVDTATSAADGGYTLDLPVGTYDLQVVDDDPTAPTYQSAALSAVKVAQDGALSVAGASVASLPDVTMALSSADTPHAVTGGVVDALGDDVDGLTVTAVPQGNGEEATTTTGADGELGDHGRFRLMLKPGSYEVHVAGGSAWVDATYLGGGVGTALVVVQLNGGLQVNGTPVVGSDLGATEMTGTTQYDLSGTVTDGTDGLPGITVKAYGDDPATPFATTTASGSTGAWTLTAPHGLVVGSYTIELSGTSGGNTYDRTYVGGATPTPVEVHQGGVVTLNGAPSTSTLAPVTMTRSSADTPHPVAGSVTDANGDPVDGATVTAVPQTGTPAGNEKATTTDATGAYTLQVKPGTYRVTVAQPGFDTATYPGGGDPALDVTVLIDGTLQVAGATLTELDPVALVDSVGDATISGRAVSSAGGAALGGLTVEVFPAGDHAAESLVTSTTTSTTGTVGSWAVHTLKIGAYDVRFSGASGGTTYDQTFFGGATATPVQVGQGNVVTVAGVPKVAGALGDTALTPASSESRYDVTGEVVDANGDGIDGLTVTATASGAGQTATALTGADGDLGDNGRFRLSLKPGTYHLTVPAGTAFGAGSLTTDGETAASVVVVAGGAVTVDGDPADGADVGSITLVGTTQFQLRGTVTDGSTGLPGITVTATPLDPDLSTARTTTSASDGAFTFTGAGTGAGKGLQVGTYTLGFVDNTTHATRYQAATYGGATPAEVKVDQAGHVTVDGAPVTISVTMTPVASDTRYDLVGLVYDPNGDPLDGVTVTATPVGSTPANHLVTGTTGPDATLGEPAGVYRLAVLPGTYQLGYSKAGFEPAKLSSWEDGSVVTVTVGQTGVITAPGLDLAGGQIDDVQMYLPAAKFATKPKLTGTVAVGQVVQTTTGTLQGASIDNDYVTISWFLNGKPADDFSDGSIFQKFKIPASAAGKKLSYTISIDDPDGLRAPSLYTSPAFQVPYVATVKAVMKKGILTLTLSAKGAPLPVGSIVVKEGKKTVGKATLTTKSKGKAVIKLTKLKKGKHKLTIVFSGGGGYGPSQQTVSVKR